MPTMPIKWAKSAATIVVLIACSPASTAQTINIDKDFTRQNFGNPIQIEGTSIFPLIFYTKFIELDGKVAVCAGYASLIGLSFKTKQKFFKASKIRRGKKTILKNLRYVPDISLNALARKRMPKRIPGKDSRPAFNKAKREVRRLYPTIEHISVPCMRSKRKWDDSYLSATPIVHIPSSLEYNCSPGSC